MTRDVVVAAAQVGPVERGTPRAEVLDRLIALLEAGAARGADLVVFPELALTPFFPRWFVEGDELEAFFDDDVPGPSTAALFARAVELGVGVALGYAERHGTHHHNSAVLVERDGTVADRFRKVHVPGHDEHEPWRPFQHLERRYFEPGDGFHTVRAFGGVVGMAICNDRRWPETYRVLALAGAELVLIGYNTPLHYAPDPGQDRLAGFHNNLVMAAGAYQNSCWVVGVAKCGVEDGVHSLAESQVIAPSGEVVARAVTEGDEVVVAVCDLERCADYRRTLFDFARYRRPQAYAAITEPPGGATTAMTTFELNGTPVEVSGPHPHLLSALREELDVTSPKDGCSPSGQCGCCTVLLDGKPVVACQVTLDRAEGRQVRTLEGIDSQLAGRIAECMSAHGALQCGFCTPGIVVRVSSLLERGTADRDRTARHLGAHLCRCTGYRSILDAVDDLAAGRPGPCVEPGGVGARGPRYQGRELALGTRGFIDDMRVEGLLHAALVLTEHARADVLGIDVAAALAAPGVVAVLTAADVPGELRVGLIDRDWPVLVPVGGRTSYAGDALAVAVASTRAEARAAAALVRVDYRPLTPVVDPAAALLDPDPAVWGTSGNVLSVSRYRRGAVDAALAASVHRIEETFDTQRVEHAFLEPESTLAVPLEGGRLHVYSGGQGVWDDRDQIASVLGVAPDRVTVELVTNGGAFGGKEDLSNQAQTALAAWLLARPVKCTLSREESLRIHAKRHPITMTYRAGCDADGRLSALHVRLVGDSGAYASVGAKVLERAAGHASGPYEVPSIDVEAVAVRTNNPVCGAFRGFGANQVQFAMEGVMDRLAAAVGISGWEIRRRNVIRPGSVWGPGQIMDQGSAGASACLEVARAALDDLAGRGLAVGVALGLKNSGLGNGAVEVARAVVRFESDGTVEVRHCWTEMGQGVHTVALQVAADELGVDPSRIRVVVDTSRELGTGQTTGSRGTVMGAGSVADACRVALADGCKVGIDYPGEYRVDWTQSIGSGAPNPTVHSTFGYAAQVVGVDRDTGAVAAVVAVHDVGRAVNPLLCEGQVVGAVHMGLGYACSEDFPADESGFPVHDTLRALGILRAKDMPEVSVRLLEVPAPRSPYGIKGVGEIGLVPTAGAVASALHELDGRWRVSLPMRP